jgi:hypothetical protein
MRMPSNLSPLSIRSANHVSMSYIGASGNISVKFNPDGDFSPPNAVQVRANTARNAPVWLRPRCHPGSSIHRMNPGEWEGLSLEQRRNFST